MIGYYSSVIHPIQEYALQVYHFTVTVEQSDRLEGFQRLSLKIIYGFEISYRDALERSGLEKLSERCTKSVLLLLENVQKIHDIVTGFSEIIQETTTLEYKKHLRKSLLPRNEEEEAHFSHYDDSWIRKKFE